MSSDRHSPEDLAFWAELEEADRKVPRDRLDRLEFQAAEAMRRFCEAGPCYLAASGGKDSSVLWAIAWRAGLEIPVFHIATQPIEDPHTPEVLAELARRYPLPFETVTVWCSRDADGWHATGTLEKGIREIWKRAGTRRAILGVRAGESGKRKRSCLRFGVETGSSCRPLAWWRSSDVFGFAAIHGVPLHPSYGMLGGGRWDRDRIRVSYLGIRPGEGLGKREWEDEYYRDVKNRWRI